MPSPSAVTDAPPPATITAPPPATSAPPPQPAPAAGAGLTLVAAAPPDGALVEPRLIMQLTFDRPLDPRSIDRAVMLSYPAPGVVLLADPFRHVGVTLAGDGRTLLVEPPEMLVGRDVLVRVSESLRGQDGSTLAEGSPRALTLRVRDLPR